MSRRLTKEELDEQFELFLKESISDDSLDLGSSDKQPGASTKSSQKSTPKQTVSWWQDDDDTGGGTGRGLLGTGRTFRKSLRKSQPIREEDEDPVDSNVKDVSAVIRDKSETEESISRPALSMTNMGMDTLEEEEEKARFFAELEAGASSTIDYSKLNRELDSTTSTTGTNIRKADEAVEQSSDDQRKGKDTGTARDSPDSPHYSEDFEDDGAGNEPQEEKTKISPILAKVCLSDSLANSGGDDRTKNIEGSLDRAQSYGQSGGSDMEALHEAYRQIHVVEDSDGHNPPYLSSEGRVTTNRPVSPSSPPLPSRHSLQPVSTNESELPTAEELMRPIRPEDDHIRGFTLQPVSALEYNQDKPAESLQRTFLQESSPEPPQKVDSFAGIKGSTGQTSHPSGSQDPPNYELTWSIREEVEKLMQDHKSSSKSPPIGKAKKPQTSRASVSQPPSMSYGKKPTVAAARGRTVETRTSLSTRSSGFGGAAPPAKSLKPVVAPQRGARSSKSQGKDSYSAESGLKVSNELVASVQSLVAVLQQQIDSSGHQETPELQQVRGPQETSPTRHSPNKNEEDSSVVAELRVQLAQKEREVQMMKEGAEELHSLRQQNYVLQSKLRSAEEANQKNKWADATNAAKEEKFQKMDKEIKEQETLIKGYQQENEKLYLQMKTQHASSKASEEAMFNENQRLLSELAFMREQLNKTTRPVGNVCLMGHTQRIADLLSQITAFQRNEAKLLEDIHQLQQQKQALNVDLQLMKKERDLAKTQAASASGDKTFEVRVLEDKHREEVASLKKKLQWFAENQELLDRDTDRLKAATAEIHQLKEQVEKLKMNVGRRSSEQQKKSKEKAAETKRMQDLERQVKELEHILRNRNPNSLPALIFAAASASAQEGTDAAKAPPPSQVTVLLERRIQRLEAELESHDEESKRSLRAMEQQFQRIKLRYEQQISELEQQLEQKQQLEAAAVVSATEPQTTSQVQTLKEELQRVKATHQQKETSLQDKIECLQQQLQHKAQASPGRHQRQAEAAFGVRIDRLNQELSAKTRTIQELNRTVERLQKERRSMLCVPNVRAEGRSTESRRPPAPTRTPANSNTAEAPAGEETFPAAQYEKTYQPTVFTGSHISEVLQENEALKQHLETLQLQTEQEKQTLKADVIQAQDELCRLKEDCTKQLSSMKAEHLRVENQLRATFALEHSSSKVAELTNKINTQEILVQHLQEQLKELQGTKSALAVSRTREDALEKQLTRLLQELKEAKEAQSPEVKLLSGIERKICNMQLRHEHREKELQQVIGGSWPPPDVDLQSEVERWKRLAKDKSREVEAFRLELDSILDILRHLQRQGVVIPTPL
ncbi:centrosomal protein of 162 kDa isoform X2 [Sphaeramia orbicularis]|uniref:centrosomal protein of 162 kDa isoform X2 n=1 Tax=Sphaeramia orbicularis TaxID=375764 RepID=UPI00117D2E9E|nr:centrosomal protein of 162 kDa isoform X2 [Sphaeramia orbicularis]